METGRVSDSNVAAKVRPYSQTGARLRNAAPEIWEAFLNEVKAETLARVDTLMAAPPDQILRAQGSAQQANHFLTLLQECHIEPKKPEPDK